MIIGPSMHSLCSNHGRFSPLNNSCICEAGWSGERCRQIQCANGGLPNMERRWCRCPVTFTGQFCEQTACRMGSLPNTNSSACDCPDDRHYAGRLCETLKCENNGSPVGPECICSVWYTGQYCGERSTAYFVCISLAGVLCFLIAAILVKKCFSIFICSRCRANTEEEEEKAAQMNCTDRVAHVDESTTDGYDSTSMSTSAAYSASLSSKTGRPPMISSLATSEQHFRENHIFDNPDDALHLDSNDIAAVKYVKNGLNNCLNIDIDLKDNYMAARKNRNRRSGY